MVAPMRGAGEGAQALTATVHEGQYVRRKPSAQAWL